MPCVKFSNETTSGYMCFPNVYRVPVSSCKFPTTCDMLVYELGNKQFLKQSHVFIEVSHSGYGGYGVYLDKYCTKEVEDWYNYPALCYAVRYLTRKE